MSVVASWAGAVDAQTAPAPAGAAAALSKIQLFNIPSQPLGSALVAYSNVVDNQIIYDSRLVAQRRSSPVVGLFSPDTALRMLIEGSGLTIRYTSARDVTLVAVNGARATAGAAAADSGGSEGALTLDGDLQEIKGGYELVARRAGCPVVMVHLDGLWGSIFSFEGGKWFFKCPRPWRRKVCITFAAPVPAEEASPERLRVFWEACAARERARLPGL